MAKKVEQVGSFTNIKEHAELEVSFYDDLEMVFELSTEFATIQTHLSPQHTANFMVWCKGMLKKFEKIENRNNRNVDGLKG